MPNNLTNTEENRLLDLSLDGTYLALFTSDPGEEGAGTEVSGGAYARVQPAWAAAANGSKTPNEDVVFPVASANWGTVSHVGLMSALAGGVMRWYGPVAAAIPINSGDRAIFPAVDLVVALDAVEGGQ